MWYLIFKSSTTLQCKIEPKTMLCFKTLSFRINESIKRIHKFTSSQVHKFTNFTMNTVVCAYDLKVDKVPGAETQQYVYGPALVGVCSGAGASKKTNRKPSNNEGNPCSDAIEVQDDGKVKPTPIFCNLKCIIPKFPKS